ncbi:hypothetical protein ACFS07_18765 [Undibacterium arcticum]
MEASGVGQTSPTSFYEKNIALAVIASCLFGAYFMEDMMIVKNVQGFALYLNQDPISFGLGG